METVILGVYIQGNYSIGCACKDVVLYEAYSKISKLEGGFQRSYEKVSIKGLYIF